MKYILASFLFPLIASAHLPVLVRDIASSRWKEGARILDHKPELTMLWVFSQYDRQRNAEWIYCLEREESGSEDFTEVIYHRGIEVLRRNHSRRRLVRFQPRFEESNDF